MALLKAQACLSIVAMFQTIGNVQKGEAVGLQQYIDNRCGKLRAGLRSLTYTVGWYNVMEGLSFLEWHHDDQLTQLVKVPPGLYGFKEVKAVLESGESDVLLEVNKTNGIVTLTISPDWELKIPHSLTILLGLKDTLGDQRITNSHYVGARSLDFALYKAVCLYLEQLNTYENSVNDAPSTLLQAIPVGRSCFGAIEDFQFERPLFKRLQGGTIGELKLTLRDKTTDLSKTTVLRL